MTTIALGVGPRHPQGWGRWPQHRLGTDYVVMDGGMMPYASRVTTCSPLQRPVMAPQFMLGTTYTSPTLACTAGPPYQPQLAMTFGSYNSAFTPTVAPFKQQQQYPERSAVRLESCELDIQNGLPSPRELRSACLERSRSPSIKSEIKATMMKPVASNPPAPVNKSTGVLVDPAEFSTSVDCLMKAIQAKAEAEHQPDQKPPQKSPQPPPEQPSEEPPQQKTRGRKYRCRRAGCDSSFAQKTHLKVHMRAHTGEKPYVCKFEECGQVFSQSGNLKTHERRHTGERPFTCDECGKSFAQRGNVRAHLRTHMKQRPFVCKLDTCDKKFTQLGNLKHHQNKFHVVALQAWTAKFALVRSIEDVSEEDRDMWEYFATLYKNSNKGIKGRGKERKVRRVVTPPSPVSPSKLPLYSLNLKPALAPRSPQHSLSPHSPVDGPTPVQGPPHLGPAQHPPLGPLHLNTNSIGCERPLPGMSVFEMLVRRDYDIYEDLASVPGRSDSSMASVTMCEEDHGRGELAFGDRMY